MKPNHALAALNARFQYKPDQFDSWRILRAQNGALRGDCDDYALTLAWMIAERKFWKLCLHILTLKSVFWYCRAEGTGGAHIVLKHGGRYADNITAEWRSSTPHRRWFPMLPPLPYLMMLKEIPASILRAFFFRD